MRLLKPSDIKYIIIHHSQTADGKTLSWDDIRVYHKFVQRWRDIGYQFGIELIENDYEYLVGRMLLEEGAHCATDGMNTKSIGICVVGNFDLEPPRLIQLNMLTRLVRSLQLLFNIPYSNVLGHREVTDYKTCPGKLFDMNAFRAGLKALEEADASNSRLS